MNGHAPAKDCRSGYRNSCPGNTVRITECPRMRTIKGCSPWTGLVGHGC
jgi:hypothetical protein